MRDLLPDSLNILLYGGFGYVGQGVIQALLNENLTAGETDSPAVPYYNPKLNIFVKDKAFSNPDKIRRIKHYNSQALMHATSATEGSCDSLVAWDQKDIPETFDLVVNFAGLSGAPDIEDWSRPFDIHDTYCKETTSIIKECNDLAIDPSQVVYISSVAIGMPAELWDLSQVTVDYLPSTVYGLVKAHGTGLALNAGQKVFVLTNVINPYHLAFRPPVPKKNFAWHYANQIVNSDRCLAVSRNHRRSFCSVIGVAKTILNYARNLLPPSDIFTANSDGNSLNMYALANNLGSRGMLSSTNFTAASKGLVLLESDLNQEAFEYCKDYLTSDNTPYSVSRYPTLNLVEVLRLMSLEINTRIYEFQNRHY